MPRPHYPPQGGPRPSGWSNKKAGPSDKGQNSGLEAEVRRLKQELSRARGAGHGAAPRLAGGSLPMVWAALAVCGAGLLFALLALLRHG